MAAASKGTRHWIEPCVAVALDSHNDLPPELKIQHVLNYSSYHTTAITMPLDFLIYYRAGAFEEKKFVQYMQNIVIFSCISA